MNQRLDITLTERKIVKSRSQALDLIKRGKVKTNGIVITKPSTFVSPSSLIEVENNKFVSRGGLKLEHALIEFLINPKGKICLDIGASTGGFTDCLIQGGALKVYAIDVGKEQFNKELANNSNIIIFEKTDIRNAIIPEKVNLTVVDVSFISLSLVLKYAKDFTQKNGDIVALVKPQFEIGKEKLPRNGIVVNYEDQQWAIQKIQKAGEVLGLLFQKYIKSPIDGGSGNKEFLIHFKLR